MFGYFVAIVAVLCTLSYGCGSGPPSSKDRSIPHPPQPGGTDVLKVCTERPPSYTAFVDSQLNTILPLLGKTEAEADLIIKGYLSQQPGGTESGEDLNNYMFYICQMSNNGKWSEATTERLINRFIDKWGGKESEDRSRKPKLDLMFDGFSQKALQDKFPLPLILEPSRTAILNFVVYNVGNGAVLNPFYSVDVSPLDVRVDRRSEVYEAKPNHHHYQAKAFTLQPVEIAGTGYKFPVEVLVPDEIDTFDLLFRIFGDNLPHEDLALKFRAIHYKRPAGS